MTTFRNRTARWASVPLAAAFFSLSAWPVQADEDRNVDAEALAKCARIKDREARLVCFDAVAEAVTATRRAAEEKEKAEKAAAEERRKAEEAAKARAEADAAERAKASGEAERRAAELEAREAELARREAELARRQAEADKAAAELNARRQRTVKELEEERARVEEARRTQEDAIAARDAELARKDRLIQRNRELVANRLPQTLPILFGIGDLSPEKAAKAVEGLDYEEIFARKEELDRIELKVVKYGYANTGKAWVILEDGQMWRQRDTQGVRFTRGGPKTVEVKRGYMGSYFMRLDGGGTAIRCERLK